MKKEIDKHKWTLCNRCEDIKSFSMEDVMCYIFNISLPNILKHLIDHLSSSIWLNI